MRKLYILVLMLVALACTRELSNDAIVSIQQEITFTATHGDPETRTIRESDGSILWSPGDQISLFYGSGSNGGNKFTAQNTEPARIVNFSGTIGVITGGNGIPRDDTWFWATYPYRDDVSCDGKSITTVLPSVQTAVAETFDVELFPSVARSRGYNLAFYNVCGGLKFTVSEEGIKSVTLRGNAGETLAGTINFGFDGNGLPKVNSVADAVNSITLAAPEGESFEVGKAYYIVLIPTEFKNGFTLTFSKGDLFAMYEHPSSATIRRSVFGTLTAPDSGLQWGDMDYVYIPDPVFREYMIGNFDTNGNGKLEYFEAKTVNRIDVNTDNIFSLQGIEYCTNLTYLSCCGNGTYWDDNAQMSVSAGKLTNLDVSQNTALTDLTCNYNRFTSLDVSNNSSLSYLSCCCNLLTNLDVSHNAMLYFLDCGSNKLTSLDVSHNPELQSFNCYSNQLTSLDVSQNPALRNFNCYSNQLTSLDVSKNSELQYFYCYLNQLAGLDVSANTALIELYCYRNQLTSLDVSHNTSLRYLRCDRNQLTSLDVSQNTALYRLYCYSNQLTSLDVSHNPDLNRLYCYSNQLTSLDVSHNTGLQTLDCSPMNDDLGNNLLEYLYIFAGQSIPHITTDRSDNYIPSGTVVTSHTGGNDNPVGGAINNLEQLVNFINSASGSEVEEWSLEADIDCMGETFLPVPVFSAVFDGKNHKIYNYHIASDGTSSGFFTNVSGTIKNISFGTSDGINWDGLSTVGYVSDVTTGHTGGVCAELSGTLENVKSFAKITVEIDNSTQAGIGGLVGYINSPAAINSCENGAGITLSGTLHNYVYIGGIVGNAKGENVIIENCINSAPLGVEIINDKAMMLGGIAGRLDSGAVVENCQNTKVVKYTQDTSETGGTYILIAGIAGGVYTNSVVKNCTNRGDISSNRNQVNRIGGIVGTLNNTGLVENNINYGIISINQEVAIANWQAAGGIVGFQEKASEGNIIRNNTNYGTVKVSVENATLHQNKVSAGGIIGLGVLGLEVYGNENNGAVSLTNRDSGASYAGGIIGWIKGSGSYSMNNENKATVFCKTTDDVDSMAGGIVGYISDAGITITSDKSLGSVTCGNASQSGAIAGLNVGTISSCFAGGSVNGTALTELNFLDYVQGSASSGSVDGTSLAL